MKTETTIQTIGKQLDDMIAECEQFRREASLSSDGTVVPPGEDQAYTVSHAAFYMLGRQIWQVKHIRSLLLEAGLLPDKNPDYALAYPPDFCDCGCVNEFGNPTGVECYGQVERERPRRLHHPPGPQKSRQEASSHE